jgi:glycosyltransferase involved in cell wall biosynthesis
MYPDIVKFFKHPSNLGGCRNYEFVIERAQGEYIAHLDGDDLWLPGKLEAQVRFMKEHPECSAVFTNGIVLTAEGAVQGVYNNKLPELQDIHYLVSRGSYLVHSSMMYSARCKPDVLSFNGAWVDDNLYAALAKRGVLGYLNGAYMAYRIGVQGCMNQKVWDVTEELLWKSLRDAEGSASAKALLSGYSYFWGYTLYLSFAHGRRRHALNWAKRIRREIGASSLRVFLRGSFFFLGIRSQLRAERIAEKISGNTLKILVRR